MSDRDALYTSLLRLEKASYGAYKSIKGTYEFPEFSLMIDYVQGDPFATPSRLRVRVPQTVAGFAPGLWETPTRAIALRDYLARSFAAAAARLSTRRGTGKSGSIAM
ncbi:MAG: ABC-ATPase domain-containing protein, partial [Cyanobacteria bacterium J06641_5]